MQSKKPNFHGNSKFGWLKQNKRVGKHLIYIFISRRARENLYCGKYKVACPNFHKLMAFNFHMAMIASTCPHKFAAGTSGGK